MDTWVDKVSDIQKCPSMSNNHLVWKRKKGAFESTTHIILFSINQRFAEAQSYGQTAGLL